MTSNEMIALLEIYRGTFAQANNMGTINQDIAQLMGWGLVGHDFSKSGFLQTTEQGDQFIERVLNTERST